MWQGRRPDDGSSELAQVGLLGAARAADAGHLYRHPGAPAHSMAGERPHSLSPRVPDLQSPHTVELRTGSQGSRFAHESRLCVTNPFTRQLTAVKGFSCTRTGAAAGQAVILPLHRSALGLQRVRRPRGSAAGLQGRAGDRSCFFLTPSTTTNSVLPRDHMLPAMAAPQQVSRHSNCQPACGTGILHLQPGRVSLLRHLSAGAFLQACPSTSFYTLHHLVPLILYLSRQVCRVLATCRVLPIVCAEHGQTSIASTLAAHLHYLPGGVLENGR